MHYLISDIHGDYEHFIEILNLIHLQEEDELYILGDLMDRGKDSFKLLQYVMDHKNIKLIKGNHELFYELNYERKLTTTAWCRMGGLYSVSELASLSSEEKEKYYQFVKGLPHYIKINVKNKDYFLCHSGVRETGRVMEGKVIKVKESIDSQIANNEFIYLCDADMYKIGKKWKFDETMIVGHFPTLNYGRPKIYKGNFIDIDTGNGYRHHGGILTVLRLEDFKHWSV
ncbi:MAG: fructose-bisphosphatase class III [Erysipelotrichaceae bacterium]|nr:fructose-bisphosphatase class III [Erysipelotrichaceae bacterium]